MTFSLRSWRAYSMLGALVLCSAPMSGVFLLPARFRWETEAFFLVFAALAVAWLLEWLGAGAGQGGVLRNA